MPKKQRKVTRRTILIVTLAIAMLSATRGDASMLPMSEKLGKTRSQPTQNILFQLQQYYAQAKQYYLGSVFKEVNKYVDIGQQGINEAISNAIGDLGLPDLFETEDNVQKTVQETAQSVVGLPSTAQASHAAHQAQDAATQAVITTFLGKQGQTQARQELEQVGQQVLAVQQAGQVAQGANVTQDVLKAVATQNSNQASLLSNIYQEQKKSNIVGLVNSTNLLKINQQMEQERWNNQIDSAWEQNAFQQSGDRSIALFNALMNYQGGS